MIRKLRAINKNCESLMLTIPKYLVDSLNLKPDQDVDLDVKGQKIIINLNTNEK